MMRPMIQATDLAVDYATRNGSLVRALDGADLSVLPGEKVAVIGESGSGKTTLGLLVGRLLPSNATHVRGELVVDGTDVFGLSAGALREFRKHQVAFIFQNPIASLDPTRRVGRQLLDSIDGAPQSRQQAGPLLERVGLDPGRVNAAYPHELSGGMAQRVAIAMAISRHPKVIVADEPTSSLDSTVRGEVMRLLLAVSNDLAAALLILTHDIRGVVSMCDSLAVMYGGRVAEVGPAPRVLAEPAHPYTKALLASTPPDSPGMHAAGIPGAPPVLAGPSQGCAFQPRCPVAIKECVTSRPQSRDSDGHLALCHLAFRDRPVQQTEPLRSAG